MMMMPATAPRVVLGATARSVAPQVRSFASAHTQAKQVCITQSVRFIYGSEQKASRIVQNGACTQKQAFVYRVLRSPLACRSNVTPRFNRLSCLSLLSNQHIFCCEFLTNDLFVLFSPRIFHVRCTKVVLKPHEKQDVTIWAVFATFHSFYYLTIFPNAVTCIFYFVNYSPSKEVFCKHFPLAYD